MSNQTLIKVANDVVTSDHIIGYLDVVKNNLNMSVLNQAMIYMQNPMATNVCGKKAWLSKKRTVNANAVPIVLFFPNLLIKEDAEPFDIDGMIQYVKDTDVTMYIKEAVYENQYIPVNAFDVSQTSGDEIKKTSPTDLIDTILDITNVIPVRSASSKTRYDKTENKLYYPDNIDFTTEHGKQRYNEIMLNMYIDYIFDNHNITDKILKKAVQYVIYEHYNIPHNIKSTLFKKLDTALYAASTAKITFIEQLNFITSNVIQDLEGYYLTFDETAFLNTLLYTSDRTKLYININKVLNTLDDNILNNELYNLRSKLLRTDDDCLKHLYKLRQKKQLYTYPAEKLDIDIRDYLREARNDLFKKKDEYNAYVRTSTQLAK